MAGLLRMENGIHTGIRSNHDRDGWMNGVNGDGGISIKREHHVEKGKGLADRPVMEVDSPMPETAPAVKMEDVPDELQHITAEIIPINMFLSRLAQFSHAALQDQIAALASKPLPQGLANGNATYHSTTAEDTSPESLEKKTMLLNFIHELHTRWVKALVLAEWSKKADQVGKLIDIRTHLATKLELFNMAVWDLIKTKQDMLWAKVPSPDLKTALEVLARGKVTWMPEFDYVPLPPVSDEEKQSFIENLDTLLHARLSLDEYERIPDPFRDYKIENGRVTFVVPGEFEVDLTISDEDFEKQFWFIDFRFQFQPAPAQFSEQARMHLELKVNDALATGGLPACYNYLHELTLTAKIVEFARQAKELSSARWTGSLKVERLDRALAVQYWVNRPHSRGTKSWIILAVNSGKGSDGVRDPKRASYLSLRWFRDNLEIKNFDITFDVETVSMEKLLTTVTGRHIEHLLSSMYNKLASKPRFAQKQARLDLQINKQDPGDLSLTMQLLDQDSVTASVDPFTGSFSLLPLTPIVVDAQKIINSLAAPAEEGAGVLEILRCQHTYSCLVHRARSVTWNVHRATQLTQDELKSIVHSSTSSSREPFQSIWLRMAGWNPQWAVLLSMSLGGDQWWLVEQSPQRQGTAGHRVKMYTKVPINSEQLRFSDTFFRNLTIITTGMIAHITDFRELHTKRMFYTAREESNPFLPPQITMPTVYVRLSDMLTTRTGTKSTSFAWQDEYVPVVFKGVRTSSQLGDNRPPEAGQRETPVKTIAEARLVVKNRGRFQFLKGNVDHDVSYNPRIGEFSLRLCADMGVPVVQLLSVRIQALERLIDMVEAIRRAGKNVVPQSVTLREVIFSYSNNNLPENVPPEMLQKAQQSYRVRLDLTTRDRRVNVMLDQGNPHLRVIDYIRSMANSPVEFEQLPMWFVFTLPLFRAIERVADSWDSFDGSTACNIFHKSSNWVTLRFILPVPGNPTLRRAVNLDIKPHTRQGKIVWHVNRAETDLSARNENDEFNRVLKQRVWSAKGAGFRGLTTGAAARPDDGIEALIALIDDSMRSLIPGGATGPPSSSSSSSSS
ncbi:putative mediator of RNA polymerase II transcription subunit 14 [Podospora australis]|uniref:Mediator of RNA polymerase II transcription subunit 14 n=1 Tax=Podospora australis TaxID=1536484 RepID=A0AAN6WQ34_9PEZI|nr:putative mediator of RNA polymerase II transcription subunit 14 [Podospora australis]